MVTKDEKDEIWSIFKKQILRTFWQNQHKNGLHTVFFVLEVVPSNWYKTVQLILNGLEIKICELHWIWTNLIKSNSQNILKL